MAPIRGIAIPTPTLVAIEPDIVPGVNNARIRVVGSAIIARYGDTVLYEWQINDFLHMHGDFSRVLPTPEHLIHYIEDLRRINHAITNTRRTLMGWPPI